MSDLYQKITAPIAADNHFGGDARYDLDFDRLKNEMEKLSDIGLDTVESLSIKILTEKSKDVRVLAWLAYVMMRRGDLAGLADVFSAVAFYCQNHFDAVFPTRGNAKNAALRWFSESRFSGLCEKITVTAADVPHLTKLIDALSTLKAALDARFPDGDAPPTSSLYKYATGWKKAAETAAKPAAAEEKVSSCAASSGPVQPAAQRPTSGSPVPSPSPARTGDKSVVIELTDAQYRELSDCIQKVKTLLKIQ